MIKINKLLLFVILSSISFNLSSQSIKEVSLANNKFALDLYNKISKNNKTENLLFSPFSIYQAMSVVYSGSRNNTKKQMQDLFYFSNDKQYLNITSINKYLKNNTDSIDLNIINSIWIQEDYKIRSEYINIINNNYKIPINKINFKNKSSREKAVKEINNWVANNTEKQILQLIKPSDLSKYTRLLLVNAMSFYGEWLNGFDKDKTTKQIFKSNKNEYNIDFMNKEGGFLYYSDSIISSIKIPYKGNKQSVIVLLPKNNVSISEIENNINIEYLNKITYNMHKTQVLLSLPKFTVEYSLNLKQTFQEMGMIDAFSKVADFSIITEKNNLKIDKIIHKSKIEISEKGTMAAAATSVSMIQKTAFIPSLEFNANHPFIYFIQDNDTEMILFIGKFQNP